MSVISTTSNAAPTRTKTDWRNFNAEKYHTVTGRTAYPTADGRFYERVEFYNRKTGKEFYIERTTAAAPAGYDGANVAGPIQSGGPNGNPGATFGGTAPTANATNTVNAPITAGGTANILPGENNWMGDLQNTWRSVLDAVAPALRVLSPGSANPTVTPPPATVTPVAPTTTNAPPSVASDNPLDGIPPWVIVAGGVGAVLLLWRLTR